MRFRLAFIACLAATPALAQQDAATGGALANRIAAETVALSQQQSLDNAVWASAGGSFIDDRRMGQSRKVTERELQFGYDHRFVSPFTGSDQLYLGVAGGVLNASSHADAQNLQIHSHGWSVSAYGLYSPYAFLSFPVSVTFGGWNSDQTRDGTPLQPVYSTSYYSRSFASSFGAAVTVPVSRFLLTTSLAHEYNENDRPAYNEATTPTGTFFQTTPGEITKSSQLVGTMQLALPVAAGQIWASVGYAYDLSRQPIEDTRSEFPLGLGGYLVTGRVRVSAAGTVCLREDITTYGGIITGRVQF